jgi:tetratricopeptide (TPR) repeat protein
MAETEFKYDIFVSYSSVNKDWVRKTFIPILEKAGLKVCDYYRDFDVGAPIVMEMERAILESSKTIPVLSPAYLKSGWTEFESLMFQTLDAANRNRRVLPIILETCELPLRIKYMNCINFANPDDSEIEWQRLSRALGVNLSPSLLDLKPPTTGSRETWHLAHPYPMPPNFTGRAAELKMLDDWLADDKDRLSILRALGGFGKSALTWQWINTHVNPIEWTKLVWWSFYEGDASFEHFIEETLKYLKLEIPQGQRPQVDELLKAMQRQKILLIMDGFERALRAYSSMNAAYQGDEPKVEEHQLDCVNINAEIFLKNVCSLPNVKSKIIMTTRLTPRAVKPRGEFMLGCREVELTAMQKDDAVAFFRKQGIKGTHAEIEAACAPYGYHPLSLRLLAGRILKDFDNPADIIVAQKLKIDGNIIQQKHHVLEVSYNSLSQHEQQLLSMIACFRSPVEHKTLEAIAENKDSFENDLHDLVERGLLHFDEKNKNFDLHPIVRRFAYELLTTSQQTDAHVVLVVYFKTVPQPQKIEKLEDLAPVIELYHHIVRAGKLSEAYDLFRDRINKPTYYQLAAYELQIELLSVLFAEGLDNLPTLKNKDSQEEVLGNLANAYSKIGQPKASLRLIKLHNKFCEEIGDKENLAIGLVTQARRYVELGLLANASHDFHRTIELAQEITDQFNEATGHHELGRMLSFCGVWLEAEEELDIALRVFEKLYARQAVGVTWSYLSLKHLLMSSLEVSAIKPAIECARRALRLAEQDARLDSPYPRDFVQAHWLLGALHRRESQLALAEQHLDEALTRDRAINLVEMEANIILDLARLRYDQRNYEEAKSLAEEALTITERCGYVLQGADVNLFFAQYALEQEKDKAKAKEYAETALKLAYCDGPPYYYKVAYHEAERMLEGLKAEG